ncbi:MAG: LamG domain-containing protein [Armatimonadetes bacterium]|nr:LamG domain-containing protein [Armatimonadota bacterium]
MIVELATIAACTGAQGLTTVEPSACLPQETDYTFMWWADGFRGRDAQGRWLRCVQTGRYALALDAVTAQIGHLGAVPDALPYPEAAAQDNGPVLRLPPADLDLTITVDGTTYRCVRAGPPTQHSGPRLIESGRLVQRADLTDLAFEDDRGNRLDVEARLEQIAWPDRLTLLLEARPGLEPLRAGNTFGRAGGGYGFDGTNDLEETPSADLQPEQLTLALGVYVPEGPPATRAYPWLVCANGNEWADGHYGLALINNVPTGFANIGGGRENAHQARAGEPLRGEQWHHLALTYDGADLRLYVDGEQRGSAHAGKARVPAGGGLTIGRRGDNSGDGYRFRGVLDAIRLYGHALTAEEVRALYSTPEAQPTEGLVREWGFDPDGAEFPTRPSADWRGASMELRLTAGEETLADRVALTADDPWTRETPRRVAVSLAPGLPATPAAANCTVEATSLPDSAACPVEYDAARDWFRVDLDGIEPVGSGNDVLERVKLTVANPEAEERAVRLLFDKSQSGFRVRGLAVPTGLVPMLRDADGDPTGIPVQISKNWHRQEDRELAYQGLWLHAFSLLRIPARSRVELEFTLAYAHWGGVASASHAQLCLIGWGSNQLWDESALGCWGESICFEPDQAQAECLICDVRPVMVHAMGRDEPVQWSWTNNVGGGDFFRYFDADGQRRFPRRMRTAYLSQGPNLTEVLYAGESDDGKLVHRVTVSLYRTDDIVRGVYRLRLDAREATGFSRFVVCQIGADTYSYTGERRMALGNEDGLVREWEAQWGGDTYRTEPLECVGRVPWVSLHEAVSRDAAKAGAWANRGLVIRRWEARLGGKPARPHIAEYGPKARGADTSVIDVVLPPGVTRLEPGDHVEATIEHLVLPQFARDYYGPNANLRAALAHSENTWRMVHREAVGNDLQVEVQEGALERLRPTLVRAAGGTRAAFAIAGGLGHAPVTISGLTSCRGPLLEQRSPDGVWRVVDDSVHGRDFWETGFDPASRTWRITYTLPLDSPNDGRVARDFRFTVAP